MSMIVSSEASQVNANWLKKKKTAGVFTSVYERSVQTGRWRWWWGKCQPGAAGAHSPDPTGAHSESPGGREENVERVEKGFQESTIEESI